MCPVCIAAAAVLAGKAASASGFAALAVQAIRKKAVSENYQISTKGKKDGH
jgi:hypothetical protein